MELVRRPLIAQVLWENATYRCLPAARPCCGPLLLFQPKGPQEAESLRFRAFVHLRMNDPRLVGWEETPAGFLVDGAGLPSLQGLTLRSDDPVGGPLGREFGHLLTSLLRNGFIPIDLENVKLARTASNQLRVIDLGACRSIEPATVSDSNRRFFRGVAPIFDWLFSPSERGQELRQRIQRFEMGVVPTVRNRSADLRRVEYALRERLEYLQPLRWGRGCSTNLCRKDGRELLVREALCPEGGAYLQRMARLSEIVGEGVFSVWRPMDHLLVTDLVKGESLTTAVIDCPVDQRVNISGQFVQAMLHLLLRDVVPVEIELRDFVVTEWGQLRILEIGPCLLLGEEAPAHWAGGFATCVQVVLECILSSGPMADRRWVEAFGDLEGLSFNRSNLDGLCASLWQIALAIDQRRTFHS